LAMKLNSGNRPISKGVKTTSHRALIIGISDYDNLEPLKFCKNDAIAMHAILSSYGYRIYGSRKLSGYVSWENMQEGIINFFTDSTMKPSDTLLFYYSGHGVTDADGDLYLATSEINSDAPYARGFSFNELAKMAQRATASRVIIILDCCYSGSATFVKGGPDDAARLGRTAIDQGSSILEGEGRCIFSSCQGLNEAYEFEEKNHSFYTYYLLQGLQGTDNEVFDQHQNITADSLSSYVHRRIASLPLGNRPNQTPVRKIVSSGDIVLIENTHIHTLESGNEDLRQGLISHTQIGKGFPLAKPGVRRFNDPFERFITNSRKAKSHSAKQLLFSNLVNEVFSIKPEDLELEVPIFSRVSLVRGRIDTVFGDLIIEFKVSLERELEEARAQLITYLQAYKERYPMRKFIGIATDNLRFVVYSPLIKNDVVIGLNKIEELYLEANELEFLYLWFDSYLFTVGKITPTSADIRRRFGIDSPTYSSFIQELSRMFSRIGFQGPVKVKYSNWQAYLEVVYGDKPSEVELFFNHTYLATLSKLLAYYRISGGRPIPRNEIKNLVYGDLFRRLGIFNFIEEDFFTWFFFKDIYDYSIDLVFRLSNQLQIYDLNLLNEDILKELYQELVGTEVRHTLGEYYTPDWLAELILQDFVTKDPLGGFLDPACGSGTFLFSTIKLVMPQLKKNGFTDEQILTHVLEKVVGIDINPLAVVIARTNYLLALKEIIKSRKSSFSIPVYLADSIKIPKLEFDVGKSVSYYRIDAENMQFGIPEDLARKPVALDSVLEKIRGHSTNYEKNLQGSVKIYGNSNLLRKNILDSFKGSLKEIAEDNIKQVLIEDLRTMLDLIDDDKNSIWSYILKNVFRPVTLKRRFKFVIGNPPWLALQFMMDPSYQKFLKDQTFSYKLIEKNQTHLFPHLELATLFFCKISDTYLEDNGVIGFVMPKSVLSAMHHRKFIRLHFPSSKGNNLDLRLETILDLEGVRPLFNIPSCVLVAKKGEITEYPVPMTSFNGFLPSRNEELDNAKHFLKESRSTFTPVTPPEPTDTGYYYTHFFQGATIFPRNFWFVSIQSDPVLGFDPTIPYVKSSKENVTKKPWNVFLEGNVEADCLYGTIIGGDVLPFGYKRVQPVVMPLIEEGDKLYLMKSKEDALSNGYPNLSEYLGEAESYWKELATSKAKSFTVYEWLNYRNKLTNQYLKSPYKVLYVATATFLASCVISKDDPLIYIVTEDFTFGLKGFVAESKTYFYETDNELEAFYLCAILNSKVVDDWIKPMQNKGDWGERDIHKRPLLLPIPKFDPNDSRHGSLGEIGKKCKSIIMSNLEKMQSRSIGRDRSIARKLLVEELNQINDIVVQLIDIPNARR
jgi:type I restriction-modification system DNA methylase subunit